MSIADAMAKGLRAAVREHLGLSTQASGLSKMKDDARNLAAAIEELTPIRRLNHGAKTPKRLKGSDVDGAGD